jgi:hypothetical protein
VKNNTCSNVFIQSMMLIIPINILLYKTAAGRNRVGSEWKRERKRKREADKGGERQSLGENLKERGLRNDHSKRYLSISDQRSK